MNRMVVDLHQTLLPIDCSFFWLHNIDKIRKILIPKLVVKIVHFLS